MADIHEVPHAALSLRTKALGDERQSHAECILPIVPCVASVTHTQLVRDSAGTHSLYEIHVVVKKEVLIAHINEPTHRGYPRTLFFCSILYRFDIIVCNGTLHEYTAPFIGAMTYPTVVHHTH